MSIFLDWFGVIADNGLMTRRWRIVEARLLQRLYGGNLKEWVSVHDRTFQWYSNYWSRYGPRTGIRYLTVWRRGEVGWMKRTIEWAGVDGPSSERELFKLSRELVYETARRIDSAYSYSRRVLEKLREARCRLFLVSGADSGYIKGAFEATRLGGFFEKSFSPDTLNAFKGGLLYWRKILRLSKSEPEFSIVVDDKPRFLRVPARLGFKTVLVSSNAKFNGRFVRMKNIKELLSADVLPNLKRRGS